MSDRDRRSSVVPIPPSDEDRALFEAAREATEPRPDELHRVQQRLARREPQPVRGPRPGSPWRVPALVAAACALVLAVTLGVVLSQDDGQGDQPDQLTETWHTGAVEQRTVRVDGALEAVLHEHGEVRVEHGTVGPIVLFLEHGTIEVDFEAAAERGLEVRAGDVTVSVVGTRFTVTRDGDYVAVSVAEGRVEVRWPGGREELGSGQRWSTGDGEVVGDASGEVPALADAGADPLALAEVTPDPRREELPDEPVAVDAGGEPVTAELDADQGSPEARLLARIQLDRATGKPPADRMASMNEFLQTYPDSAYAEEVLAFKVEALAAGGDAEQALLAAEQYVDRHPDGVRRLQVRWLEATVARDRLQDCRRALPAYREVAVERGPHRAEATYFWGVCASELDQRDEAVWALQRALTYELSEDQARHAQETLDALELPALPPADPDPTVP